MGFVICVSKVFKSNNLVCNMLSLFAMFRRANLFVLMNVDECISYFVAFPSSVRSHHAVAS